MGQCKQRDIGVIGKDIRRKEFQSTSNYVGGCGLSRKGF